MLLKQTQRVNAIAWAPAPDPFLLCTAKNLVDDSFQTSSQLEIYRADLSRSTLVLSHLSFFLNKKQHWKRNQRQGVRAGKGEKPKGNMSIKRREPIHNAT